MREWTVPRRYKLGQRALWQGVVLVCTRDHYAGDGAEHPWDVGASLPTLWAPKMVLSKLRSCESSMPDSAGKIRGIAVPSVPWHELKAASLTPVWCDRCEFYVPLEREPHIRSLGEPFHYAVRYDEALRDADQMLWDKQTDEGPSALEKLRDKS